MCDVLTFFLVKGAFAFMGLDVLFPCVQEVLLAMILRPSQ